MHIIMTNDDGLWAPGLQMLAHHLAKDHRVTIVAPKVEQSGKSHALTLHSPIFSKLISEKGENPTAYFVDGTPADCMKFALSYLMKNDMPDLVISGINHGFNLGSDALYSGTIGGAMEGIMYNIPSLAISVERFSHRRIEEILPFISEFVDKVFDKGQYKGMLNMNFPQEGVADWDHCKLLHQGFQRYTDVIDARHNKKNKPYYWIGGSLEFDDTKPDTDVAMVKQGYVTVVPLTWVQEDREGMAEMKHILGQ